MWYRRSAPEEDRRGAPLSRWRWWCVVAALVVIAVSLAVPSAWVESAYAHGLYPWINRIVVPATSALPVPWTALVIPALLAWGLVVAVRRWRHNAGRGVSRWRRVGGGARWLAGVAVVAYAVFLCNWGFGYRRPPIEERLHLGNGATTHREVGEFVERLLDRIAADQPRGEPDAAGAMESLRRALQDWVASHDGWTLSLPATPVHLPAGMLLTFGVSGVISPFTLEAHVDGGLPAAGRVAVGAHEFAHLAGFCGEADADLVSFLAGLEADDAYARYCVALRVLMAIDARLPPDLRESVKTATPARARADIEAIRAATRHHRSAGLARFVWSIYDSYLQSQGVAAGVDDYGRGVDLLVRCWRRGLVRL